MDDKFSFILYRLNIIDEEVVLKDFDSYKSIASDDDLKKIIQNAVSPKYDYIQKTSISEYSWCIRNFADYGKFEGKDVISIMLARSLLKKEGDIVDDEGIKSGTSFSSPPLADTVVIFFDMQRHFVGVEYKSFVAISAGWIKALRQIIKRAASDIKYSSSISLQPVTKRYEIVKLFKSFERLIKFKVNLRLPNPDYSPAYQDLYERMDNGGIKEYLQVMKNPNGLSQSQKQLPYKSALIAEAGYKEGPVTLHGIRNGEKVTIESDGKALRSKINTLRDYVRGMGDNAKAKEATHVIESLRKEMNRLFPLEVEK